MDRIGFNKTVPQAMHPFDSAINRWVQTETPGRAYYYGAQEVDLSFGGQIGAEIKRLNLSRGDDFLMDFVDFPPYHVVRPIAPPASPPNIPRAYP